MVSTGRSWGKFPDQICLEELFKNNFGQKSKLPVKNFNCRPAKIKLIIETYTYFVSYLHTNTSQPVASCLSKCFKSIAAINSSIMVVCRNNWSSFRATLEHKINATKPPMHSKAPANVTSRKIPNWLPLGMYIGAREGILILSVRIGTGAEKLVFDKRSIIFW